MRSDVSSLTLSESQVAGHQHQAGNGAFAIPHSKFLILLLALLAGVFSAGTAFAQRPTITTQPVGATNTANTIVSLTVAATGPGTLRYQWYFNETNVLVDSGANTPTLLYTNILKSQQGIYTVAVSNSFGAVTSAPVIVIVIEPPEVTRQPTNVTVAVGGTATFRLTAIGDPPLTYQWFFNVIEPILDATNNILVLTNLQPANSGTYQAEITNPADTVNTREAVLIVKYPPAFITPPPSLTVTQGGTATFESIFSGDPPLTFQWVYNGTNLLAGATNSTLVLTNVQTPNAGDYVLRIGSDVGAATSAVATLSVLLPPGITQNPTNLTVIAGSPASFSVAVSGNPPFTYQWLYNGSTVIPDATNATLTLPAAQPGNAGFYSVRVSNTAGTLTSASATLSVLTPPVITQNPASLTVFQGQPATFAVAVTGSPTLAYQWFFNGTNRLTGATSSAFTLASAQPANVGTYSVVITNRAGAATSEVATLTVQAPPVITQQPVNRSAVPGGSATFSVLVQGGTPLFYQWFFNSTTPLPGATNPSVTLADLQSTNAGTYSVRVTNAAGFAISSPATLTIKQPPVITQQPASLVVTQGSSANFSVAVSGDGPFGYRWFFNETNVLSVPNSPTLAIASVQSANAGLYSVQVTNDAASTVSSNAALTVRVPPAVTQQPADVATPPGGTATFTVTATGDQPLRYQWFFETNTPIADATNATLTVENVQLVNDGRYSVSVSNDVGSTNSVAAALRVRNLPTIVQAPASLTVTQGHTATFSVQAGGDGPFLYQWFFNATNPIAAATNDTLEISNVQPAAEGAYSVQVTNLVGFVTSPEATLAVRLIPTITQQPAGLTVAVGGTATFSVAVTGEAPFTYQWRRNGSNVSADATNATLVLNNVQLAAAGNYSVLVSNAVGFAASADAVLSVKIPPSIVEQPASVVSTQRLSATFSVVAAGDAPLSYQWFFNATNPVISATNAALTLNNLQPSDAGAYSVRVTNIVGSIDSAPAALTVELLPQITQQPVSLTVTQGQTATMTVTASSDLSMTYQWRREGINLGSATAASLALENVQPAAAGAYDVIVASARGSVTSVVATLTVRGIDFGDAPEPAYPTLLAGDAARHVLIPGIFLGAQADAEPDGQPASAANGDDLAGPNDEDGVRFLSPLRVGQSASIEVVASVGGFLNAWIDFSVAGGWAQAGEQIFTNQALVAGTNVLSFSIPATATLGGTFARFRFSTAADLSFTGLAPDGEVEDYALTIVPAADLEITQSSSNSAVGTGSSEEFFIRVVNRGPSPATGVSVTNRLSGRSTFVSAVSTQGGCTHSGGVVICNAGSLASSEEFTITLVATIGQGTNITTATVVANEFDPTPANNTAAHAVAGTVTLPQFANSDIILMPFPDSGQAVPYPAPIFVSGANGIVNKVTVTLRNVNHDFPEDMDVLLVGPQGQAVMLMSDCGFDRPVVDATITLSDDAAESLPDNDPVIVTGTYRPANFGVPNDPFDAPAPSGPFASALSAFKGADPNGVWSLYVMDDSLDNGGSPVPGFIADGWTLTIVMDEPLADLAIASLAQPASVPAGSNLLYTITVTNRGPSASTAIVRNPLPPGAVFLSATASQGACANTEGVITCDLGSLPAGIAATITAQIMSAVPGSLTNTVTVSGGQLDLVPANDSASASTAVLPIANVGLTLSASPSSASLLLGQSVNYLLTVTNAGPNAATGVTLTNTLPAGMSFVSALSGQGQCTNTGGVVRCSLGNILPGGATTVQITATASALGAASNHAALAGTELDFDPANNAASHLVTIVPAADLSVAASPAFANVAVGRDFITLLTVSNRGPSSSDATLVDTLPAAASFVSATTARGGCVHLAGQVQCQFTNLAPGESASVILVSQSSVLGSLTNVAQVSGPLADAIPGNNAVTNVAAVVPSADLALTMSDRPDPVLLGEDLTCTLAVTNNGPNAANGVMLTNVLPPGVGFISAVLGQGSCGRAGNEVVCNLGSLAAGAGVSVALLMRPGQPGFITNSAVVASQTIDATPSNNASVQATRVLASSGTFSSVSPVLVPVQGQASPYPSTIFVSGLTASVFYARVTLNNLSHSFADDLDILLVSPEGRSVLLMSDCGGDTSLGGATLTFDDGANPLPDSGPIFSGVVRPSNYGSDADIFPAPAPSGPYGTNLAVFNDTDPNGVWSLYLLDDADKDAGLLAGGWSLNFTTLNPISDMAVGLAVPANPAAVGSNILFTCSVTNRGPATAPNVRLTNDLPSFLTSRSFTTSQGACGFVGDSLVCSLGNMPAGAVATVTISAVAPVTGVGTNSVVVTSDFTDLRPANNAASAVMTFELPPFITLQPLGQTAPPGANVQFTTTAVGAAPLVYQWQRNGVDLVGANSPVLALNNVANADAGVYRLRVNNAVGVALSDPAVLLISGPPVVSPLADLDIDEDTDTGLIPFTVQDFDTAVETLTINRASSNPALVPPGNIVFAGAGSSRTVRVTPLANQFGVTVISVIVSDTTGASTTNQFTLTVRSVIDGIQITAQPRSLTIVTGATASLSVSATSTLPLAYQWQRNGQDVPGAVAAVLSLPDVQMANAGTYQVLVSNTDTSVASVSVDLQVFDQAPAPAIVSITQTGPTVTVTFTTVMGANYTLEYKDSFSDPSWTPLDSVPGTSDPLSLVDPSATVPTRFYRVRVN